MKNFALFALLPALVVLAGCATDDARTPTAPADASGEFPPAPAGEGETVFAERTPPTGNLVETAIAAGFSTLVAAVDAAGLVGALEGDEPLTVFAPSNAAFDNLPEGLVAKLLLPENKEKLQQILLYHVVAGEVLSDDLRLFQRVETLEGSTIDILRYFRLIKVNDSRVRTADVLATNGVIHVIDRVLIPAGFTLEDEVEPTLDIVQTAIEGNFDTLVAAVVAADLVEALQQDGPLTVFAPSEEAFGKLPAELLNALLLPENKSRLTDLLLYHVVGAEVRSSDLGRFQFVKMLNDGYTFVRKDRSGRVRVNRAEVAAADVLATNGVIHVIDEVLIPYSFYGSLPGLANVAPADHPGAPDAQAREFESLEVR